MQAKIIPQEMIKTFTVRFYDKSLYEDGLGIDEDYIEVIYGDWEYALGGHPAQFEGILGELLKAIEEGKSA